MKNENARITSDDVREAVTLMRQLAQLPGRDDEALHAKEDELRELVLRAIAAGAPHASKLAAEVLLTGTIEFARNCA